MHKLLNGALWCFASMVFLVHLGLEGYEAQLKEGHPVNGVTLYVH